MGAGFLLVLVAFLVLVALLDFLLVGAEVEDEVRTSTLFSSTLPPLPFFTSVFFSTVLVTVAVFGWSGC